MSRHLERSFAVSLLIGASLVVGADLGARRVAEARTAAAVARHPEWRIGAIRIAPFARAIELDGFATRTGGARVAIGRVRLPLWSLADVVEPAAAETATAPPSALAAPASGTISAENLALSVGTTTVRIKRIDLAGTTLTNADLAALLDPKAPDSVESRLKKLTATAVVIPEIAIDDTTVGAERHVLLHQILIANVSEGKAAAASAADASLAMTNGRNAVNGTSGAIEASGVDLAQTAHVLGARRKDASEPIRQLFDKAVINAPRLANAAQDAGFAAESVAATGVGARPLASSLDFDDTAKLDPTATSPLYDLAHSVRVGTMTIEGLDSHGKASGETTKLTVAKVDLTGLADGKAGSVSLRDFRLDGPYAKLAIGTADVGSLQVPAQTQTDKPLMGARPERLDLGQVEVEVEPRDKPGVGAPMRFTIDHVALSQSGGPSMIPASGSAALSGLAFDLVPDGTLTRTLYDMGYRHVTVAAALTSSYDVASRELTVRPLSIGEPAMGSIEMALRFANVSPDVLSTDPETAQDSAMAILAKGVDLKLANSGLVDKAIAFKAKQDGVSVADERTWDADFFANKLPMMFDGDASAKEVGGAIAKFIADPRTLHISIASKEGLGIGAVGMLGDPGALLESLDVHADADD